MTTVLLPALTSLKISYQTESASSQRKFSVELLKLKQIVRLLAVHDVDELSGKRDY